MWYNDETSGIVRLVTNDNWYVRSNSDFINLVGGNRNGSGSEYIKFTMPENTSGIARTGEIFLVSFSRGTQYSIMVTQNGYDLSSILDVVSIPKTCSYEQSTFSVSFNSKYSWKVSINVEQTDDPNAINGKTAYASPWSGHGSKYAQTTKITVPKNYGRKTRNIIITLENDYGIKITKTVVQQGAPKSVPNLYGFEPSNMTGNNSASDYAYRISYQTGSSYTNSSVSFDASENWSIVGTTNGLTVNRTSGGTGHNVVQIKLPLYDNSNGFDFMVLSGSQLVHVKLYYGLIVPPDNQYIPISTGGNWDTSNLEMNNQYMPPSQNPSQPPSQSPSQKPSQAPTK